MIMNGYEVEESGNKADDTIEEYNNDKDAAPADDTDID